MNKNNKSNTVNVNKGMFAIIVILVALLVMFAIDLVVIYRSDIKDLANKAKNNSSEKVSNSSISFEDKLEIDKLIGTESSNLSLMLSKDSLSDVTNDDILYYLYDKYLRDSYEEKEGVTFTKEDMAKAFKESALSDRSYTDGDIVYSFNGNKATIWKYDSNSGTYSYNPAGLGGFVTDTMIAYTYNLKSYVENNKYIVVNKYLFTNSFAPDVLGDNIYSVSSVLYGNYNSAISGRDSYDKNATNYVTKLDNIYAPYNMEDVEEYAINNYDSIKDKLDTYTYTFEKKDGHFVITDFSVEHSK